MIQDTQGGEPFHEGIPYYIWNKGSLRIFEVQIDGGEIVRAYLDPSNQYSADGPCWRREDNGMILSRVTGFRCIDGIAPF